MARQNYKKDQLVPEAHQALDNMKYQLAAEYGLPVHQGSEDYWGNLTSRECGSIGGAMTKKLIQESEDLYNPNIKI